MSTVITADALELMARLNQVTERLIESVKELESGLQPIGINPILLTPEQAAEYTGISVHTLAKYRSDGVIGERTPAPHFVKIGSSVYYPKADLERWCGELQRFKAVGVPA